MSKMIKMEVNLNGLIKYITNREPEPAMIVALGETMRRNKIDRILRISHFIAQLAHESGGFRYTEELASGDDYEGRTDLGNNQAGDGRRYKGRGYIQLTGRANYTEYSRASKIDFVSNPIMLSHLPYAMYVSGWYWTTRRLNVLADRDDIREITRIINGGTKGLRDRISWYDSIYRYIGSHQLEFI